jgi:hypothetical protein
MLLISTLFDGRPLGVFGLLFGIALGTLVWYRTLRITDELRIVRVAERGVLDDMVADSNESTARKQEE